MDETKAVYTGMAVGGIAGFGGAVILGDLNSFVDADQSGNVGTVESSKTATRIILRSTADMREISHLSEVSLMRASIEDSFSQTPEMIFSA